jgi:hypothetical protein
MSDKISICKLIGQSNYEVWSLRVQSLLVHGSLSDAIAEGVTPKSEIDQKALANIVFQNGSRSLEAVEKSL